MIQNYFKHLNQKKKKNIYSSIRCLHLTLIHFPHRWGTNNVYECLKADYIIMLNLLLSDLFFVF